MRRPQALQRWFQCIAALMVSLVSCLPLPIANPTADAKSAPHVDWSKPKIMRVLMVDNRFIPDHLTFHHGVTYRLHLENHGKDLHEFTAPQFFAEAVMRDPSNLANGGQEIVVQPGARADVDLVPQRPGHYDLRCADHDWDGMVGSIDVQ